MNTTDLRRVQTLFEAESGPGPVIYWMSRDQRIQDNWALVYAQERARAADRGLIVLFCLLPGFLGATWRHYHFMLHGLRETCRQSLELGIPFILRRGEPRVQVPEFVHSVQAESLVCDFDPLRVKAQWRQQVGERVSVPVYMVDAHNVVPCWETSQKQEYAARTIRPKIQKKLFDFLHPIPTVEPQTKEIPGVELIEPDWDRVEADLDLDVSVGPVKWLRPGPTAADQVLDDFVQHGLSEYEHKRNDPNANALSNLSPYFHFGHIGPHKVAYRVWTREESSSESRQAFLEEMIIRRELSDNFCWHNPAYDTFQGLPNWARTTLNKHRTDPRLYLYSFAELEKARTHDDLWNAAQMQMVLTGKMHGYMRMYWAKKILEWTESPEQALAWAITLNDRYELDGRDPNGYVGVLWSVGGLHDRGFKERPVLGTIRPMSYAGCKRKFDVQAYIRTWMEAER